MAARICIALVAGLGVLLLVTRGFHAFVVFAFFAGIAALAALGAGVGGGWLERSSAGRFRDHDRDR